MLENLKEQKIWFCWKLEKREEKLTKIPYSALNGRKTGTDEKFRSTWTDFNTASDICQKNGYSGVGFKIPEDMFFLDIDHVPADSPIVQETNDRLGTYAETSQSGNGVHFYGYINIDKLPISKDNGKIRLDKKYYQKHPTNGMELYFGYLTNRYAAFTGNAFNESELKDCTDEVLAILEQYMLREQKTSDSAKPKKKHKTSVDYDFAEEPDSEYKELQFYEIPHDAPEEVQQIIYSLCHQKNCDKFTMLFFEGNKSDYTNDKGEIDDSRADAALCAMIAFRTGPDRKKLIDAIFRYSAICRDKWLEREDYRELTIDAGIEACHGVFHHLTKERPDFVLVSQKGKLYVNAALLAQHVRFEVLYHLVRDNGKQGILTYVYENGVYRLYAPEMMKSIIKWYVTDYDLELLKMGDVNEAYNHLITDMNYIKQSDLNADENLINFTNGLLYITSDSLNLKPHTPDVLSTIQIPCQWTGKETPTPVFDSYINTLCNWDESLVQLCMEIIGVCLSNVKGYRMKKAPFFYGDGDTGKSQLKALVERLLGEGNYVGIDLQEIEARFGTGVIYGMRLAGSSDMSFMSVDELKTFKKITGGDSLFAEFKGQQGFEFTYSGMLWFCMNRLPKFGGDDGQWVYDRILPIECVNVIPKDKQDKCLLEKMYAEREGIVYKAVKALQTVIANGYRFSEPEAVLSERKNYMAENNSVLTFYNECLENSNDLYQSDETTARIYDVYRAWCKDNNNGFAKTSKEFRDVLCNHLGKTYKEITCHSMSGTHYKNLSLNREMKSHYFREFTRGAANGDFQ